MITYGPFKLIGLKEKDITSEIDEIITNAKDILIVGGYSFTNATDKKSPLYKIIQATVPTKHVIFPIGFFGQHKNLPHAKELIRNNVSVSFEHDNHSKWMLNENSIYFGSANFSKYSLKKRIEVVSFKDFDINDPLKNEFCKFAYKSMLRMRRDSNLKHLRGLITRNFKLIEISKRNIKRLNPSISKVYTTIEGVHNAQYNLNALLQNSYWILGENYNKRLFFEAKRYFQILETIYKNGCKLIDHYERGWKIDSLTNIYNKYCHDYLTEVDQLGKHAEDFLISTHEIPKHTIINRDLVLMNQRRLKLAINK